MGLSFSTESKIKSSEVSVKVIRADGTVEDLGVVAYYSSNPLRRFVYNVKAFFKRRME